MQKLNHAALEPLYKAAKQVKQWMNDNGYAFDDESFGVRAAIALAESTADAGPNDWIMASELAARLGRSRAAVTLAIQSGRIPGADVEHIGRTVLVHAERATAAMSRKGQMCRIIAPPAGKKAGMNSALVEFDDGYQAVVSRNALRRERA